jgi:hypothetical protein
MKFGTIRGHKHYQLLAGKNIAVTERLLSIRFRIEHRATKIAYVIFNKRGGKNNEFFIDKNQILEELFRTDVGNENHDNSFSLEQISNHEKLLMPYIDYISALVELYACLCLDNNIPKNVEIIMKAGATFQFCLIVLRNEKIHVKIRNSISFLMRVMYLQEQPFN